MPGHGAANILAGYKACTLTWYDPALGGMNSATGAANPNSPTASGEPYDPHKFTCAAPPDFPFGTYLRVFVGSKNCQVKVNDRGGWIQETPQGPHFDLSKAAADTLGITSSGTAQGKFKVTAEHWAGAGAGPSVGPDIPGAISHAASSVWDAATAVPRFLGDLSSLLFTQAGWMRLLKLFIGVFLGVVAIHSLFADTSIGKSAGKVAETAAIA